MLKRSDSLLEVFLPFIILDNHKLDFTWEVFIILENMESSYKPLLLQEEYQIDKT